MIEIIGAVLGGGFAGVAVKAARDVYVARVRREEHAEKTAERRDKREDDTLGRIAQDDREDRRRMEAKVEALVVENREQAVEIARISSALTRCEEKHVESEVRDRDKDRKIEDATSKVSKLEIDLDFSRQLSDRLRVELDSVHVQLDEMRSQLDAFVKTAMGVRSISEVPGE